MAESRDISHVIGFCISVFVLILVFCLISFTCRWTALKWEERESLVAQGLYLLIPKAEKLLFSQNS